MANIATSNNTFQQFNSLSQLHIVRQLGFMLLVAAGIALGTATVLWSVNSEYVPLFQNMSTQDSSDIVTSLEQNGTQYKINSSNGQVTVPSNKVQEIRLQLATDGLPGSSNNGYDILNTEQSLGTSNFIERARYNRALEQELEQTIKNIEGVRDARVHLSIPKQTSFLRNANNPSASVMIDLVNAQIVNETQLMGVVHLVASSVSGLETEDVSIIDQRGNLISQHSNPDFNSSNENIRFTREVEEDYNNRIIDILTPIVGPGNVHAQVSAELDFTFIETTEEVFNPDAVVIRSEQIQQENSASNDSSSVEPGSLSPIPPVDNQENSPPQVQASGGQSRINSTRNYEIDHSVSLIRKAPGTINRLSVAVLVDLHPGESLLETTVNDAEASDNVAANENDTSAEISASDQQKIDRLTQLVRDTIGYSEIRGDSVNVISEQFVAPEEFAPIAEIPIWQQPWVYSGAKKLGAAIVVIFLIFGILKPAMKSVVSNQSSLPSRGANLPSNSSMDIADDTVNLSSDSQTAAAHASPGKSIYDQNLSLAQELVTNEPARAARMIQSWVADDQN